MSTSLQIGALINVTNQRIFRGIHDRYCLDMKIFAMIVVIINDNECKSEINMSRMFHYNWRNCTN
jgi:hypothetical protein